MSQPVKTAGGNAAFHNFVNDFAHIDDPLERRRLALEKIDNAKFSWYHVRAITVGGVGFLTDSYDIFAINIATSMMGYVYWGSSTGGTGAIPSDAQSLIKVSTSVGTVVGQLGFGMLADIVGRKRIYGTELMIIIAATICQTVIGESPAIGFVGVLTFWRIVMGIGIGGDYPLSSIITSEFATTKWRGAIMGAVFANQGWGQLLACIVGVICVAGWKNDLIHAIDASECTGRCITAVDQMWRLLVGFGCVPAVIALYFRLTIPETPRYTFDVSRDLEKAVADSDKFVSGEHGNASEAEVAQVRAELKEADEVSVEKAMPPVASLADFRHHFGQWKHMKILIATAGSWFLLDIAFYGLGLNNSVILEAIGFASKDNVYDHLFNVCVGNIILVCAGSIPGYWFSVFTIDVIGRRPIQVGGFIILTVLFCVIGFAYNKLSSGGLLALYVLSQFFMNFGPNVSTFIVPGECYPTRYRSTAHGISAASGKIGAIVAQSVLGPLINHGCAADQPNCWLNHVMEIFALFMFLGIFTSLLMPETKRQTLEDLAERLHGEVNLVRRQAEEKEAQEAQANSV